MSETIRHHPVLGEVRWDEQLKWWEAQVQFPPGVRVDFCLSAEKAYRVYASYDELIAAGIVYLTWARAAEQRCREQIADDLLDCYNEVWSQANDSRRVHRLHPTRCRASKP